MTTAERARTVVVTGAASGIGLATAERLLADGATVVGADLTEPPRDLGAALARMIGQPRVGGGQIAG